MESKDLNKMEFSALIISQINYEIVLKSRSSKAKPKEKNLAFKAKEITSEEEEELALYANNIRRYKSLLQRRKKDMKKGTRDEYKKNSSFKKKSHDSCYKCDKLGHYAKDCRVPTSKSHYEKNKKKEVLLKKINNVPIDHSSCLMEQQKLREEIDRIQKEFFYVVNKFSCANEKFEKLLSLQRFSLSKHGLGCDPFIRESSLINKFSKQNENDSLNLGLPRCTNA